MTKILVIEDEAPLRESIVDTLSFEGFNVIEAANGNQGWEMASAEQPDLIVCDVAMPELNGYELLEKLRQDPTTANLPFIFLTARSDRSFMRHGMELGADDYVTKPFSHADLLAAIRSRLKRYDTLNESAQEELEQVKTELTRRIAHELRTPLTSIAAVQDIVEMQLGHLGVEELRELLTIQRSGSQRLQHLVEQTVMLTELKTGKLSRTIILEKGMVTSIWDILTAATNTARKFAYKNRDLPINVNDRGSEARVLCSLSALRHALAELIGNALSFSPENGEVQVNQWVDRNWIWIAVEDHGAGIADLEAAIAEFGQIDREKNEQQGMGLGLPLAKQIVEAHGGGLHIKTNSKGTQVAIQLPLYMG
jgi:signal transduction histidine kinase